MFPSARRRFAFSFVLLLAAAAPGRVSACDSAGCLMATRGQTGLVPQGRFSFDLSFGSSDQDRRQEGSRTVAVVSRPKVDYENGILRPAFHEDLGGRERFLQLDAGYGLGPRTAVTVSLPLFAQRRFDVGHGRVVTDYDTRGVGDAVLGVRRSLLARTRATLVGGLSVKLATGDSRLVDVYDGSTLEPMLQPGTGSTDVIASTQLGLELVPGRLSGAATASYQATSTNSGRYRFGNETIVALALSAPLPGRLRASLQVKNFRKGRSVFLDDDVPSTGMRVVYVTPGVRWAATPRLAAYAFLSLPVDRFVNETQLAPRRGLLAGVSKSF